MADTARRWATAGGRPPKKHSAVHCSHSAPRPPERDRRGSRGTEGQGLDSIDTGKPVAKTPKAQQTGACAKAHGHDRAGCQGGQWGSMSPKDNEGGTSAAGHTAAAEGGREASGAGGSGRGLFGAGVCAVRTRGGGASYIGGTENQNTEMVWERSERPQGTTCGGGGACGGGARGALGGGGGGAVSTAPPAAGRCTTSRGPAPAPGGPRRARAAARARPRSAGPCR